MATDARPPAAPGTASRRPLAASLVVAVVVAVLAGLAPLPASAATPRPGRIRPAAATAPTSLWPTTTVPSPTAPTTAAPTTTATTAAPGTTVEPSLDGPPTSTSPSPPAAPEAPAADAEPGGEEGFDPTYVGAPYFRPGAVYTENFPDPSVVYDAGTDRYYAFSTTTGGVNVPVMTSPDAVTWTARTNHGIRNAGGQLHDGLPDPSPPWVTYHSGDPNFPDDLWAPGVGKVGDRWVVFYALRLDHAGRRCIFYATSDRPDGPYLDPQHLHCGTDPLGSIDPQPFTDPATGTTYLVWQDMGTPGSHGQRLWARPIVLTSPNRVAFTPGSELTFLLESQPGWEAYVSENPSLVRLDDGRLALFYSGGSWDSDGYSVGLALCSRFGFTWTPSCQRTSAGPFMNRRQGRKGIGGSMAFRGRAGQLMLGNHSWDDRFPSRYPDNQRRLLVEPVYDLYGTPVPTAAPGPPGRVDPSSFVAMAPSRLLDTRTGPGTPARRRLERGEVVEVPLTGRVTTATTHVVVNVTADGALGPGFVTAYGCGRPPGTSNLNHPAGAATPNLATVALSARRSICLYAHTETHLVVDLQGRYDLDAATGFSGVAGTRLVDTRGAGSVAAGRWVEVQVAGRGGVPADARVAALNLTVDRGTAPGFLTAWSCEGPVPTASNVNHLAGRPSSNASMVPLSPRGTVCVYSLVRADVIVDVFGYVGPTGARFRGTSPSRVLDTRTGPRPAAGAVQVVDLRAAGVDRGSTAVVLNVTATDGTGPGYLVAYPCGASTGGTSVLNVEAGETRAAHVTVAPSADLRVCVQAQPSTHVVVDLVGNHR